MGPHVCDAHFSVSEFCYGMNLASKANVARQTRYKFFIIPRQSFSYNINLASITPWTILAQHFIFLRINEHYTILSPSEMCIYVKKADFTSTAHPHKLTFSFFSSTLSLCTYFHLLPCIHGLSYVIPTAIICITVKVILFLILCKVASALMYEYTGCPTIKEK